MHDLNISQSFYFRKCVVPPSFLQRSIGSVTRCIHCTYLVIGLLTSAYANHKHCHWKSATVVVMYGLRAGRATQSLLTSRGDKIHARRKQFLLAKCSLCAPVPLYYRDRFYLFDLLVDASGAFTRIVGNSEDRLALLASRAACGDIETF